MSNGLDDLQNRLNDLSKSASKISGDNNVSFDELFTSDFMFTHSRISNYNDFFEAAGIHNEKEFSEFPDEKLDIFVNENTDFSNWEEMKAAAGKKWVSKQLGF